MRYFLKSFAARCLNDLGIIDHFEQRQKVIHFLMLHQVNPAENAMGLSISPELFESLVEFLKSRHELISIDQAIERLLENHLSTACVLTFDDGYRDNYDFAFPILKKHDVPATIFVTLDALDSGVFGWDLFDQAVTHTDSNFLDLRSFELGKLALSKQNRQSLIFELHNLLKTLPDSLKRQIVNHVIACYGDKINCQRAMLSWSEAREMANSKLITIGAHTITHPILSRVDSEQAENEIIEGKACIEERLGLPVHYFAYPNGSEKDFNKEHVDMVRKAGYRAACSTIAGSNGFGSDLFALKRIDVTTRMCADSSGRFSPSLFLANLAGWFLRGGS